MFLSTGHASQSGGTPSATAPCSEPLLDRDQIAQHQRCVRLPAMVVVVPTPVVVLHRCVVVLRRRVAILLPNSADLLDRSEPHLVRTEFQFPQGLQDRVAAAPKFHPLQILVFRAPHGTDRHAARRRGDAVQARGRSLWRPAARAGA